MRNSERASTLNTDEPKLYTTTCEEYAKHEAVNHSRKEYARSLQTRHDRRYQHCGEVHLHRYLVEFDFRYNRRAALKVTNNERHDLLAKIEGKRLTYRRIGEADHA